MASTREDRSPEPEVWTARLRDFVHDCVDSAPCEEADRVREAALLLQSGAAVCDTLGSVDPVAVEAMLSCGATESAVLAMLGRETVFMLSRGQADSCLATVIVRDGGDEVISEGSTLALALLSAYVAAVLSGVDGTAGKGAQTFTEAASRLH